MNGGAEGEESGERRGRAYKFSKEISELGVQIPLLGPLADLEEEDLVADKNVLQTEKERLKVLLRDDPLLRHLIAVVFDHKAETFNIGLLCCVDFLGNVRALHCRSEKKQKHSGNGGGHKWENLKNKEGVKWRHPQIFLNLLRAARPRARA